MKTITLEQAYAKAIGGKLISIPANQGSDYQIVGIENSQHSFVAKLDARIAGKPAERLNLHNAALLAHCFNHLNELHKCALNFIDCINNFSPEHKTQIDEARKEFEEALIAANKVSIP